MDEATRLLIENYQKLNETQRRGFNVRVNGEEHRATARNGVANIHFPVDGQLMYITEMGMKVIVNDGLTIQTENACDNWNWGTSTYTTLGSWLDRYPVGSKVDVDCTYGCQCWDYAAAFWRAQVNRNLETGNGMAWGCWDLKRDVNAGSEFELIFEWHSVKKGDWVVWGSNDTGHIAMALEDCYVNAPGLMFRQQNGATPDKGVYDAYLPFEGIGNDNGFIGAFRYHRGNLWSTD